MALWPSQDPNSTKYPDRVFHGGQWRTREQIERYRERDREQSRERYAADPEYAARHREWNRENNARRLRVGGMYLGVCGFTQTEREAMLNGSSD